MASTDPDEEALAWAGDERLQAEPLGRPAPERDASDAAAIEGETNPAPASMPAPLLITYGILAGLYLIYTVGWVITVTRSDNESAQPSRRDYVPVRGVPRDREPRPVVRRRASPDARS